MFQKKKSLAKLAQERSQLMQPESSTGVALNPSKMDPKTEAVIPPTEVTMPTRPSIQSLDATISNPTVTSLPPKKPAKVTRNHSLKYSAGSLHVEGLHDPLDYSEDDQEEPHSDRPRAGPVAKLHQELHPVVQVAHVATSPLKIPQRSASLRYPRPRRRHRRIRSPNHLSPSASSRESDSDDSYYDEDPSSGLYCTPPSSHHDLRRPTIPSTLDDMARSRSMMSLTTTVGTDLSSSLPLNRDRSFLVGSVGATSLLGPMELDNCFPDRTVRIFIGTWNMNGQAPPQYLDDFLLPQNLNVMPDILFIGTQETCPDRNEWEIRLQDTLGPSHVLFHSNTLGTLHQAVFLRRDLIWHCSIPETDSFNARPAVQLKTKGATATCFMLFGTSFLFVNSHLTAHQENIKDRIKDYKKITAMLNLPKTLPARKARHKEISDKFDCVFWCGDLNFRLEQSREVVIREVKDANTSVLDFDQLNYLRQEGLIFKGFEESEIRFQPTFKYDVGTNNFDTSSKQRTPSYTDRILFKSLKATEIKTLHYDSVQYVNSSDHKPVWGIFEVKIRPGRDTVPLSGGLFNREVYLGGLKRRAEARQPVLAKNPRDNMCSVQ